jgi:hypothetical protein
MSAILTEPASFLRNLFWTSTKSPPEEQHFLHRSDHTALSGSAYQVHPRHEVPVGYRPPGLSSSKETASAAPSVTKAKPQTDKELAIAA